LARRTHTLEDADDDDAMQPPIVRFVQYQRNVMLLVRQLMSDEGVPSTMPITEERSQVKEAASKGSSKHSTESVCSTMDTLSVSDDLDEHEVSDSPARHPQSTLRADAAEFVPSSDLILALSSEDVWETVAQRSLEWPPCCGLQPVATDALPLGFAKHDADAFMMEDTFDFNAAGWLLAYGQDGKAF
jgi:hypothetical protein